MANAIKARLGTPIVFTESGGDYAWTPKNVGAGAGRLSAQADLGADPRAAWYRWVFVTKFQTATVLLPIRLYFVYADSAATTYQDGAIGTGDAAVSAETILAASAKVTNLQVSHTTAACVYSGDILVPCRYLSVAVWNAADVSLTNTAGDHLLRLTPWYYEVQ